MIYVFGIVGFIGGFALGLFIINYLLRTRSKTELVRDKSVRWIYGTAVWAIASAASWAAVWVYRQDMF